MESFYLPLLGGFLIDAVLGDPNWLPHPVVFIGKLIARSEKTLRRCLPQNPKGELWAGGILVILVCAVSGLLPLLLLWLGYRYSYGVGFLIHTIFCWQIIACRCLATESGKVKTALEQEGLPQARQALSMIVGRDTAELNAVGVVKGAVETVAENTTDGVIAPIFYCLLGGPVLGWVYKAINTMDSMVGYRNARYLYFGRVAAKLDDLANYLPARLTAILMIACCPLVGLSGKDALRIWRRDRRNHASPNSAQTESVVAGGLGVALGGNGVYGGVVHEKPTIGDPKREIQPEDISRTNRLMVATALLFLLFSGGLVFLV